jgi:RNA polymerase sigma factor (sigma-70 family)
MTATDSDPRDHELVAHLAWVQRLAGALVRDEATAADVAQAAAGAWAERAPAWARAGAGLRGWLGRAVRSLAIDAVRAAAARRRREHDVAAARAAAEARGDDDPAALLQRLERQQHVAAAVRALDEPYRTAILLRYLDELPTAEVARRTAVPEATVRKRVERGLAMLRQRLDAEFGGTRRAWCLALLGPAARAELLATWATAAPATTAPIGTLLVGACAVGLLAVALWGWQQATNEPPALAVGGHGVVVAAAELAARDDAAGAAARPAHAAAAVVVDEPAGTRSAAVSEPTGAVTGAIVRGHLFVDGVRRAPPGTKVTVHAVAGDFRPWVEAVVDTDAATWQVALAPEWTSAVLWCTGDHTSPAQVPVPPELLANGGGLDLHLTGGRRLALTFVDEATSEPLAGLPVAIDLMVETARGGGRVFHRGHTQHHATDAHGQVVTAGVPEVGTVRVGLVGTPRQRHLLFVGGQTMVTPSLPFKVWQAQVVAESPRELFATIRTRARLGEARAGGVVPAWARPADGTLADVQVMARERQPVGTDAQGFGDRFVLPLARDGAFELVADAPCEHLVQLQRTDGTALADPVVVAFATTGPQAPIVFTPSERRRLTVVCRGVPDGGMLELTVGPALQRRPCRGSAIAFDVELPARTGFELRVVADSERNENGWRRAFAAEACTQARLEVDLGFAGPLRQVELELPAPGAGPAVAPAALVLLPCRGNDVAVDERVTVLLDGARGVAPVPLRAGRWLAVVATEAGWVGGVVDVAADGTTVRVVPQVDDVPAAAVAPGLVLESVDGVSLREVPAAARTVRVPLGATTVLLPRHRTPD